MHGKQKSLIYEGCFVLTRINLINPHELMDQHLIAEYREIRLLCANLVRTLKSKHGFRPEKVPNKKENTGTNKC
jgi:hypothetical protein